MALISGSHVSARFLDALGLRGQNASRVVLVIDVREPVRAYVTRCLDEQEVDAVADAIEGLHGQAALPVQVTRVGAVEVDERGRVFVPAEEHAALRERLAALLALLDADEPPTRADAARMLREAIGGPA